MDLQGKNKKNCIPEIESEKVHLPMIENADFRGSAPPLWRPGCDSLYYLNPDFG